jgi:hypothetical protein
VALEIEASHRLVLECGGCGERLVLLGREDYWYGGTGRDAGPFRVAVAEAGSPSAPASW